MQSEVFPLEWRRSGLARGEVTVDAGTTKNGEGRTFVMTTELRTLLEEQDRRRKATEHIIPWVFFRLVAEGRRGEKRARPILSFTKAWKHACRLAGCPGHIPHDFRRTAVRNLDRAGVPRSVAMAWSATRQNLSTGGIGSLMIGTCAMQPRGSTPWRAFVARQAKIRVSPPLNVSGDTGSLRPRMPRRRGRTLVRRRQAIR